MFSRPLLNAARRSFSQAPGGVKKTPVSSTKSPSASGGQPAVGININVPGLSNKCVKAATGPVGPGAAANAEYKVPEYFCFDRFSYAEAEVEMAKYRCPQPSALKK